MIDDQQPTYRQARLPVDRIRAHPANVRVELGDLSELSDSIREHGLQQPVDVQPLGGGYFELVDGHRRYAAVVLAGHRRIDARIGPKRTIAEVVTTMLVTGVHARPLSLPERQKAVGLLAMEGMSQRAIAAQVGVSEATVSRWRKGVTETSVPAPARPVRARVGRPRTTVALSKVSAVVDQWEARVPGMGGLSGPADGRVPLELVHELLAELRGLAQPGGAR